MQSLPIAKRVLLRTLLLTGLPLAALFAAPDPLTDTVPWILESRADGISFYSKKHAGTSIVTFKGEGTDTVTIGVIAATLLNIQEYPAWMPNVAESQIVKKEDDDHFYVYQRFAFSWPFQDRDIVVRVVVSRDYRAGVIGARIDAVPEPLVPIKKGCVRMTVMCADIKARYLHRRTIEMTYAESFDPGGNFPSWLTGMVATRMPQLMFPALKKIVTGDKYTALPEAVVINREIGKSVEKGLLPE